MQTNQEAPLLLAPYMVRKPLLSEQEEEGLGAPSLHFHPYKTVAGPNGTSVWPLDLDLSLAP